MSRIDRPRAYLSTASRLQLFALAGQRRTHLARPTGKTSHLRRIELDRAFGAVDTTSPHAIAQRAGHIVLAGLGVRVVASAQCLLDFGFERLFDHQPRGLAHDATGIDVLCAEHLFKTLARGLARRYFLHRDAPVSGSDRTPPSVQSIGCIPLRIHSKSRTSPFLMGLQEVVWVNR
jgi:hypothetical protein